MAPGHPGHSLPSLVLPFVEDFGEPGNQKSRSVGRNPDHDSGARWFKSSSWQVVVVIHPIIKEKKF